MLYHIVQYWKKYLYSLSAYIYLIYTCLQLTGPYAGPGAELCFWDVCGMSEWQRSLGQHQGKILSTENYTYLHNYTYLQNLLTCGFHCITMHQYKQSSFFVLFMFNLKHIISSEFFHWLFGLSIRVEINPFWILIIFQFIHPPLCFVRPLF